jgi:seryl-tRNA synthetase
VTSLAEDEFREFEESLITNRMMLKSQLPGMYSWTRPFEALASRVSRAFGEYVAALPAITVRFPPTVPRVVIDRSGYADTFPHLAGLVASPPGAGGAAGELQTALAGAACHPVFALMSQSTVVDGQEVWAEGYVFRREPSDDPMRMMSFRQTEFVIFGDRGLVEASVSDALSRCRSMLLKWGIHTSEAVASDSFTGRLATFRTQLQRDAGSKMELSFPMWRKRDGYTGTALASANLHGSRFGEFFDIRRGDGSPAVSGCVGLGVERTVLALLRSHGTDATSWPAALLEDFGLDRHSKDTVQADQ